MNWFEDETFWRTFYPYMFSDKRLAEAPGEVDRTLALSGITSGAVLDLCCGPARHAAVLAQRGFKVTGVDRSPFLLNKARERTAGLAIEFVEADMREFVRPAAFDLALSLFTSFGYFETREQDLGVLRNVRASLKPGGVFLLDMVGTEIAASRPCRDRWTELPDGRICAEHVEILSGWSKLRTQWLLVDGEIARRHGFELNLYSGQELLGLLEKTGFCDVQIFGSLDGTPYDFTATRLVARAIAY